MSSFVEIPQLQCVVSGCRNKSLRVQEFHITNSFVMASQYTPGCFSISEIIAIGSVICRSKSQQMSGVGRELNAADICNIPDCA